MAVRAKNLGQRLGRFLDCLDDLEKLTAMRTKELEFRSTTDAMILAQLDNRISRLAKRIEAAEKTKLATRPGSAADLERRIEGLVSVTNALRTRMDRIEARK